MRELDGVLWVNDSKATNIASTRVALEAMTRPYVLLLGGRHKGEPYTSLLAQLVGEHGEVVGVDTTPEQLAIANARLDEAHRRDPLTRLHNRMHLDLELGKRHVAVFLGSVAALIALALVQARGSAAAWVFLFWAAFMRFMAAALRLSDGAGQLSARAKEIPQQVRRNRFADPGINFGLVQALVVFKHPCAMFHRPALGIGRGVGHAGDTGVHDGPGHVFVPNEHEGAVAALHGQQAGLFKQGGDLVVDPLAQDGADAQHGLLQLRVGLAVLRQHVFDQAFVVAVGKALVAAQGHVFGEPSGVVGVVAIGRAAGRDHDVLHAMRHAGLQHVARAFHVHRVFKGAVGVFAGRDDGG